MEDSLLVELKRWFEQYAAGFFDSDQYVNTHLQIKLEHTRRTCEEILYIAGQLGLEENEKRIAEVIALFHDVGRFPQFVEYRTFNDSRSVNHGCLSADIIGREGVLELLPAQERELVQTAVRLHGRKSIPEGLEKRTLFFLKMIRDADKLDILHFTTELYGNGRDSRAILLEFPDEPGFSPQVLDAVFSGRLLEYRDIRNSNDFKLCQVGWVYDINFEASLKRLRETGRLDKLFRCLPLCPETKAVRDQIDRYIDGRLS